MYVLFYVRDTAGLGIVQYRDSLSILPHLQYIVMLMFDVFNQTEQTDLTADHCIALLYCKATNIATSLWRRRVLELQEMFVHSMW